MSQYVENNLIAGENIEYKTTYHWVIFFSLRALFTLLIAPMIDRYTDEFTITNKRVVIKTGLISRKTVELNLTKIESVNVDQTVMGRIFGFGSISIIGIGGTHEVFVNIRKPLEFRKKFQELC